MKKVLLASMIQDQPEMTMAQLDDLVTLGNVDTLAAMVEYLCGIEPEKKTRGTGSTIWS